MLAVGVHRQRVREPLPACRLERVQHRSALARVLREDVDAKARIAGSS